MFTKRLISGIILVILAIIIVGNGGLLLYATTALISLIGLFELYRVMKIEKKLLGIVGYLTTISYYGIIWFDGQEYVTLMVIAALMVLPVVWGSLSQGIHAVDKKLLELARCCRFSGRKTLCLIYLPSLRPHILSALTTAAGLAWKSGVAAEVLCLPEPSLGQRIYYTKYYLDIPELFAWTAVAVTLSMALEHILRACLARWGRGWTV